MTPEQLAQIAYEAYCKAIGKTPCWRCAGRSEQYLWFQVAQAVKANVLGSFTKVGEGEQA